MVLPSGPGGRHSFGTSEGSLFFRKQNFGEMPEWLLSNSEIPLCRKRGGFEISRIKLMFFYYRRDAGVVERGGLENR